MKKVGIVTFHRSRSYGATLQAYATLIILEKFGYDCEFVDYVNYFEQNHNKLSEHSLKGYLKYYRNILKSLIFIDKYWEKKSFGNIELIYHNSFSKVHTNNISDLSNLEYDILLVGSDQVWNPKITGGIDEVYLLNFGKCKKKISYASSMGSHNLTNDEKIIFNNNLKHFSSIGVREAFAKNELEKIIDNNIKIVVDPTMLLEKKDWNSLIKEFEKNFHHIPPKYILTFFVGGTTDTYIDSIMMVKNHFNVPVINVHINKHKRKGIDKALAGVTVPEFVNLIKNASYVITDSFHGTVFSILYEKEFLALSNKNNPIRVKELLYNLDLCDRLDNMNILNYNIDYNSVNKKLNSIKEDSLEWLRKELENEK